ncbi:MAG: response regulator, partial [Limisphaerales bacterium]
MKKILVIDDEQWLREMVHMALQQKGYEVVEAENWAAGIEVARKVLPDLVLCDVNMDKMDGYLALASLRNDPATAPIPFILMTGLADNAGMRHGME